MQDQGLACRMLTGPEELIDSKNKQEEHLKSWPRIRCSCYPVCALCPYRTVIRSQIIRSQRFTKSRSRNTFNTGCLFFCTDFYSLNKPKVFNCGPFSVFHSGWRWTHSVIKKHMNRKKCVFSSKAIFSSFFSVNKQEKIFMSIFPSRFGEWDHSRRLRSFIFSFFQHFLQQYRHHRIHSFTNTKHTTTFAAAAAAVEGRVKALEVASLASLIRSSILPFRVAMLEPFAASQCENNGEVLFCDMWG